MNSRLSVILGTCASVAAISTMPVLAQPTGPLVGTLPGEFAVDNRGSANYSVPLWTPPGRQGMQPKLSIGYSSGGGNGILGIGFSLSTGFPQAITRGRSILARDGVTRGVTFTTNDKFYLDGKRLICVSGTYGTPGSSYRTEVDSFVTITTNAGTRIESFIVTDKSGTRLTFGTTDSANAYQPGIVNGAADTLAYTYALRKVEDTLGNSVEFFYTTETLSGEYVLSRIEYTANSALSISASNRVIFSYSVTRTDKTFAYVCGRRFAHNKRLESIVAQIASGANWTDAATYTLGYVYSPDSSRSQITSVSTTRWDANTSTWRSPRATEFTWSNYASTVQAGTTTLPYGQSGNPADGYRAFAFGDFTGDGKEDYIDVRNGLHIYRATAGNQFVAETWPSNLPSGFAAAQGGLKWGIIPVDLNGDGKKDLLLCKNDEMSDLNGISVGVCISTGTSFVASTWLGICPSSGRYWFDTTDPANDLTYLRKELRGGVFARFVPGNFLGVGCDQVLVHGWDGYRYLLRWDHATSQLVVTPAMNAGAPGRTPTVQMWMDGWLGSAVERWGIHKSVDWSMDISTMPCDMNGDGVTDYVWSEKINGIGFAPLGDHMNEWWLASVSDGMGGVAPGTPGSIKAKGAGGKTTAPDTDSISNYSLIMLPGDFNGDGLSDFLVREDSGWQVHFSKGQWNPTTGKVDAEVVAALPATFSANSETLFTVSRFMQKSRWDSTRFNPGAQAGDSAALAAVGRFQADSAANTMVMDINHDGLSDIVWSVEFKRLNTNPSDYRDEIASDTNRGWWVAYSNGYGFAAPVKLSTGFWNLIRLVPRAFDGNGLNALSISTPDLNGDGLSDWVVSSATLWSENEPGGHYYATGTFGDLITTITDGLGQTMEIAYRGAKDDTIYTPGASVGYPIRELRASTPVVADVYKDSGGSSASDRAHFSYQYSGNRLDMSGRGPLGFHSFVTLDRQTNLFQYQFLAQSFPMTGLAVREETYRYWTSGNNVNFRMISTHTNTVVFDEVVSSGGSAWGTVYPFMSEAVEKRWEDGTTAHYSYALAGSPESKPENLFSSIPTSETPHIAITAQSWFDEQTLTSAPQTTLPGTFKPGDTQVNANQSRTNIVTGYDNYNTFHALSWPRKITQGNLRQLKTNYGGGFTETVVTTYKNPTSNGITGLVDTVTTSVTSPGYGTESAPTKSYAYVTLGTTPTPLVDTETVDAAGGSALDLTSDNTYDSRGRVTKTEVVGYDSPGSEQHIGRFTKIEATAFDDRFDLAATVKNAYGHRTTTAYHALFGLPVSVMDVENGNAEVATTYDSLGRPLDVWDKLKNLHQITEYAWTTSGVPSDWRYPQTVSVPSDITGITLTSVYAVRSTPTVQAPVTAYYDRLGRVIRTAKEGYGGQKTFTDTIYNILGQTVAVSLPYSGPSPTGWTRTTYDALGRPATVLAPNGTLTTYDYKGRATKVTVDAASLGGANPAPQTNVTLVDAKGRTVKVWNADNVPALSSPVTDITSPVASIEYVLDGFGRMRATRLKDQTPQILATYDALGRQTSLDDPDKGLWTYVNNGLGQVVRQTDAKGNVTRTTFDRLGRQLSRVTSEPSGGPAESAQWFYYDTVTDSARHAVGPTSITSGGRTFRSWVGAPEREESLTIGAPGYQPPPTISTQYYDDKGRPAFAVSTIDGKWFYTDTTYDSYSRAAQVRHYWRPHTDESPPTGVPAEWLDFGYTYTYDGSGSASKSYVTQVRDTVGNRIWWEAHGTAGYDHLDRPALVRKGNGHWTKRDYRAEDGVLTAIKTGTLSGTTVTPVVQNLAFSFDGLGNLVQRTGGGLTESFTYDLLNRLLTSAVAGQSARQTSYSPNGNIASKQDVTGAASGAYAYGSGKPHAVTSAFGYAMTYDANGNLSTRSGNGKTWQTRWAGFDKPRWLAMDSSGSDFTAGVVGSEFLYNAARRRVLHLEFDSMSGASPNFTPLHYTRKRLYALGSTVEIDYKNQTASGSGQSWLMDKVRIYVPGPEGNVGAREFWPTKPAGQQEKALVYHYDHLGSIEGITDYGVTTATWSLDDDSPARSSRYSYDPWGERRDPLDWNARPTTATADGGANDRTPRGFTGHEMLDDLGLVHMNGRIYDPLIGRMLSADLFVTFPSSLQSYNRYSYVDNRPLTATDPSGFNPMVTGMMKPFAEMKLREQLGAEKADRVIALNNAIDAQVGAYAGAGALVGASMIPVVGEVMDIIGMIVDPEQAGLYASSMGANAPVEGYGPNASAMRAGGRLIRSAENRLDDAVRAFNQVERRIENAAIDARKLDSIQFMTSAVEVAGKNATSRGHSYEKQVAGMWEKNPGFGKTPYTTAAGDSRVADVAGEVAGQTVAVEAKYVDNWAKSPSNPESAAANMDFIEGGKMSDIMSQASDYSQNFDQVVYHTNSQEFADLYRAKFKEAGLENITIVVTPATLKKDEPR